MNMKTIAIIIFMFFSYEAMFAQKDISSSLTNNEINNLTSKLAMKLLLTDSQKSAVTNLLKTYRTELGKINSAAAESNFKDKQEIMNSINSQIVSLLDSKQKMKYDVLKEEWWTSISEAEKE